MQQVTKEHWEQSATWYDTHAREYIQRTSPLHPTTDLNRFASRLKDGARVLDFGCGSGRDVQTFNSLGFDAHGIDGSSQMVDHCKRTLPTPDNFRVMDFADYRDPPNSWDGIWAMATLLHVPTVNRQAVFSKIIASLKPGGIFMAYMKAGNGEFIDKEGRPMALITASGAANMIVPILAPQSRLSIGNKQRIESSGKKIRWISIEVRT